MRGGFNRGWADYVQRVMTKHEATLRSQRQRTGLAHTTISSWLAGVSPGLEGVIQFAQGFGEDVQEAVRAAGYPPLGPPPPILVARRQEPSPIATPRDYWWQRFGTLVDLCEEKGIPPPERPSFRGGTEGLTLERVDAAIEELLADVESDYPDQAGSVRERMKASERPR